jgi:hypothetical protein
MTTGAKAAGGAIPTAAEEDARARENARAMDIGGQTAAGDYPFRLGWMRGAYDRLRDDLIRGDGGRARGTLAEECRRLADLAQARDDMDSWLVLDHLADAIEAGTQGGLAWDVAHRDATATK